MDTNDSSDSNEPAEAQSLEGREAGLAAQVIVTHQDAHLGTLHFTGGMIWSVHHLFDPHFDGMTSLVVAYWALLFIADPMDLPGSSVQTPL